MESKNGGLDGLINTVQVADYRALFAMLPPGSVNAILTDPPYAIGLDEWDKKIDIEAFIDGAYTALSEPGFLAFTMNFPYALEWLNALDKSAFKYKVQICWIKRYPGGLVTGLLNGHENLWIFRKGKANFIETRGKYTDVKLPGVMFDIVSIEAIDRYIKDLYAKIENRETLKKTSKNKRNRARKTFDKDIYSDRSNYSANFTTVWSFAPENQRNRKGERVNHASVKPVLLFDRLIRLTTKPGQLVLDPFSGSGTTGIAAKRAGRDYILGDMNPEFVQMAIERINQPYNPPLFDETIDSAEDSDIELLPRNLGMFD